MTGVQTCALPIYHADKVPDRCKTDGPDWRQDFGRDDRGDRIRGVMKPIEEIEREDDGDCDGDQFEDQVGPLPWRRPDD